MSMIIVGVTLIISLSFALILVISRERTQRRKIQAAKQFHEAVWNNAHEFIFLIDKSLNISHTNYYAVCNLPVNEERKHFGDILQCRYARELEKCANNNKCNGCLIRSKIENLFAEHTSFNNLETAMDIQFASRPSGVYNMLVSGRYLVLDKKEYVLLTVHDINEEYELKSSLKHSNEKFLCFFDNVTVGCAICDKDGKLVEVNDTYVRYMGIQSKEDAVNLLNIYTNPCVNEEYKDMMKAGIPISGEVKYDYEKINQSYVKSCHQDVHYFRFIVNYMRDSHGAVENILIIWVENTLIHKTLRQNATFREMITYASSISKIGFCSINLVKNEQLVTPEYLKNLGVKEGTNLRHIFSNLEHAHAEDREFFRKYVERAFYEKMEPLEKNVRILIDGKYRWIKQYLIQQTFDPENKAVILAGVNVDIDAQKQTEEALREAKERAESSDQLKSAFLANMSHEIRTPLNAIVGFSDLLKDLDAFSPEEVKQFVETININCTLLLALINDILDLSRIESGTMDFKFGAFNLAFIMQEVHESQRLSMPRDVELRIEIPEGEDKLVITDSVRLKQVVNNLINNAKKFTVTGSITFGYVTNREGYTTIFVEDTGSGISEDAQKHIFERF